MEASKRQMVDYSVYTDEQLVELLRDGDQSTMDHLLDKYKNLVKNKAKSMFILGGDSDDLIQEGMIGLYKAIRDYDPGRDASFKTFAELCINRQLYTAVTAAGRQKHFPLNSYISFYVDKEGDSDDDRQLIESLTANGESDPEAMFLDKERVADIENFIDIELSDFEKDVLDLYLTGMSYVDVARVLGREEKATDNALQRIKSKIKKFLEG